MQCGYYVLFHLSNLLPTSNSATQLPEYTHLIDIFALIVCFKSLSNFKTKMAQSGLLRHQIIFLRIPGGIPTDIICCPTYSKKKKLWTNYHLYVIGFLFMCIISIYINSLIYFSNFCPFIHHSNKNSPSLIILLILFHILSTHFHTNLHIIIYKHDHVCSPSSYDGRLCTYQAPIKKFVMCP